MTKSVVVVAGTGNKNLPTVNIVTSAQAGAANLTSITPGTNEHKKVQAATSTVKGLPTVCIPNYSAGGYIAKAVHFDGNTYLSNANFSSTDGHFIFWTFWAKATLDIDDTIFVFDPASAYGTFSGFTPTNAFHNNVSDSGDVQTATFRPGDDTVTAGWHFWLVAGRTDVARPDAGTPKDFVAYRDDVKLTDVGADTWTAFVTGTNGVQLCIGGDTFGLNYIGDIADLRLHVGVNILDNTNKDVALATRRLFIDANGKPVDPATATASLGTPQLLLSGYHAAFLINGGSGGDFTAAAGALTDASTSPSS